MVNKNLKIVAASTVIKIIGRWGLVIDSRGMINDPIN